MYNNKSEIKDSDNNRFLTTTESHLVFKKVIANYNKDNEEYMVALLEIPVGTRVYVGTSYWPSVPRKCRAEKAIVHGFFDLHGNPCFEPILSSMHSPRYRYWAGKIARPSEKFSTFSEECESGIHFFTSFEEARNY